MCRKRITHTLLAVCTGTARTGSTLQEQILHEHQRTLQLRNEVKETHDLDRAQAVKDELQVRE